MCGIVGYSGLDGDRWLDRMNCLQRHRGPDDEGTYWDPEGRIALGMRRLSIIDLAGGRQPMSNDDGSLWIVFNGEIFNAPTLRQELEQGGCRFKTDHSDTEVILRLYEQRGEQAPELLNGMFAFVIYDRPRRRLFGARDPFGIKPLYLHEHAAGLAWASELKSLLALPTFSRDLDVAAVEEYLGLQYVPQEHSIYTAARKLKPGHWFTYDCGKRQLRTQQYYELPLKAAQQDRDDGIGALDIRDRFQEAVVRWSLSDVQIACCLSGGVDSAAIVAALARSGQKVKTFTLGYRGMNDGGIDEKEEARQVAQLYGTEHSELTIEIDDLLNALPDMVWHLDEPYGGGLPSWYVFKQIAAQCKVAMTGVGGDELFTNYNKFYTLELRPDFSILLDRFQKHRRWSEFRALCSRGYNRLRLLCRDAEEEISIRQRHEIEDAPLYHTHPFGLCYPTANGRGFNERLASRHEGELSAGRACLERTFMRYGHLDLRDRCVAVDFNNQLPDEFLQMTDRFSMAHSIEARTPFLDRDFVSSVLAIPSRRRFTPLRMKSIFKDAVRDWLPPGHTELKKKGFVLPMARWLRGGLRDQAEELFSEAALRRVGLIRADFKEAIYRPFLEGHLNLTESVWSVFMFRLWQEHVWKRAA